MSLLSVFTRDSAVVRAAEAALGRDSAVVRVRSWDRLPSVLRERPATGLVLDSDRLADAPREGEEALADIASRFPSLWLVLIARPEVEPITLFRLGQRGIDSLVLSRLDDVGSGLAEGVRRSLRTSTESLVTRVVSPYLPARESNVVRLALRGVQLGWTTDDLADRVGFTRAHLSVRLKAVGLPSAGHLLGWAKLLHAGRWLADPGRSGESVARQLDYSSGAAFRRALRNYVRATPMGVRGSGGLTRVLRAFTEVHGIGPAERRDRTAA